ncbi:hypothetical protein OPQ81_006270 [Rhizoctonia solani]|nr:hypothetical protein OPQ81_006270 [Rhizoctonia solani]
MARAIHHRFEPIGPVRLHLIGISKVEEGPRRRGGARGWLPERGTETASIYVIKLGYVMTGSLLKKTGSGVDKIIMSRREPDLSNWSD